GFRGYHGHDVSDVAHPVAANDLEILECSAHSLLRNIRRGDDRVHAWYRQGPAGIDRYDPRVGVRTAYIFAPQDPCQLDIGGILRSTGDFVGPFDSRDRLS